MSTEIGFIFTVSYLVSSVSLIELANRRIFVLSKAFISLLARKGQGLGRT